MLKNYLKAGYPAICLLTQEPERAEKAVVNNDWKFLAWDCLQGIRDANANTIVEETRDPVEAIRYLDKCTDTVLIAHNLHLFLDIPEVIQAVQNGCSRWKSTGCCLVMVSPMILLRPELEKLFHVLDLGYPSEQDIFLMQQELAKGINLQDKDGNAITVEADHASAKAAKGLTEFEAETAFALSLVKEGRFSSRVISQTKVQMIRKSGLMEFWEPADIKDVGGLENLKGYITNRAEAFKEGNEHLPRPKGILLIGVPGTGKSLSCKATASILGWPLIRLDIGSLKNSLVGESERRIRLATQVIDGFGEAVIWLEEIEKAFSGTKSSGETDGGTTAGMLGHFLVWLAETRCPILVMASANQVNQLPPEFLRAGRFDSIFFVDLPVKSERLEIIRIMNRKYQSAIPESYVDQLQGYSGAEIEQLAKDSLFDGLDEAMQSIIPISKVMREDINALREWAKTRARLANTPEEGTTGVRKVQLAKAKRPH
jgi:AAA+ superfamily predicted ATPase